MQCFLSTYCKSSTQGASGQVHAPQCLDLAKGLPQSPELLATGRYPRFAAAIADSGPPETFDPAGHFDRLLDKLLDGLVRLPGA